MSVVAKSVLAIGGLIANGFNTLIVSNSVLQPLV